MPVFVSDPTSETKWMGGNYKGRSLVTLALDLLLIGWWLWYSVSLAAVIVLVPSQCLLSLQTAQCLEEKKEKTRLTVDRDKPVDSTRPSSSPFESNPKGKRVFGPWTVTKILWKMRPWEFSDSPESKNRLYQILDSFRPGLGTRELDSGLSI